MGKDLTSHEFGEMNGLVSATVQCRDGQTPHLESFFHFGSLFQHNVKMSGSFKYSACLVLTSLLLYLEKVNREI